MSVFAICGYGIRCEDIKDAIVPEKVFAFLKENIGQDSESMMRTIVMFEDDYKHNQVFDIREIIDYFCTDYCCLAELFAKADETGYLSTDNNSEDSNSYLFCPAVLPWEASDSCFKTAADVDSAIISAVQEFTNLSEDEVRGHIGEVHDGGYC